MMLEVSGEMRVDIRSAHVCTSKLIRRLLIKLMQREWHEQLFFAITSRQFLNSHWGTGTYFKLG
jgi:hypothetical protein